MLGRISLATLGRKIKKKVMAQLTKLNFVSLAGLVLVMGGIFGIALGAFLWVKASAGITALDAVYAAQGITHSYDEDGNFVDRGSKETGDAILSLLEDDWAFPLNRANLDPNDPLVNTPDELMAQYAKINYHILNGTQTVVLAEDVEYKGVLYEAGSYDVPVDGRYFNDLDRMHPLEGPARTQAWSPLAFGLLAQITGGVNSDLQAGLAHFISWSIFLSMGFTSTLAGVFVFIGGIQLNRRQEDEEEAIERMAAAIPSKPLAIPSGAAE